MIRKFACILGASALASCAPMADEARSASVANEQNGDLASQGIATPELWPAYEYPVTTDAATEAKIASIIGRMTLEEKIGQIVQPDLCCVTPDDVRNYNIGSVLNGGNSGPYGNDLALAPEWLKLADEFYAASTDTSDGGVGIPVLWGTDAVHGHSNIIGATLFPHNIGLGAMRDSALIERIGEVTAREIRVTGQEWTFAPTVAVPQDFRWGRAYEGYSSNPALVNSYVGAMVRGLQGDPDSKNLLAGEKVIASTKHFLADGGTDKGVDQGDATISEAELRDIHGAPYAEAIEGGVATVMASFSSWNGKKMTGNESLMTGVLKQRMDFGGFIVSDWNAHGQVEGCTNDVCPQALLAGIDMYMAPDTWKPLYASLLADTRAGRIPVARLNDAVARILRVKMRIGLFEAGKPSDRKLSGEYSLLGSPDHRAVAREAVRKSLVLLKNQGVLPLKAGGRLLVAGDGADDVARQSGGWTITWQGTGLDNSQFPGATSLFAGLQQAVNAAGGEATLSPDGSYTQRPDAAVVVFGETPYAEFQGDRASLQLDTALTAPYETMRKLKAQGIPVVAVMITGRPLYVNPALNMADAFVVTWLPGSEGGGLADVLIGDAKGNARHDFSGKLPAAWPITPDMEDGALYPYGYGLNYTAKSGDWNELAEIDTVAADDSRVWFSAGAPASSWSLLVGDPGGDHTRVTTVPAAALGGRATVTADNYLVQEGAKRFAITGGDATVALRTFEAIDIAKETNADLMMLFTAKVWDAPDSALLAVGCAAGTCRGESKIALPESADYVSYGIPLKCFSRNGADMTRLETPFVLSTIGKTDFALGEVKLGTDAEVVLPCQ